jgi:large subunit ribosomal protein L13
LTEQEALLNIQRLSFLDVRSLNMTTYNAKPTDIRREWVLIDATDQILGRMATQIAFRLRGKHKPIFAPHLDTGDFIVVVNADKIKLTGNKWAQKTYYRHSGYMGGLKTITAKKLLEKSPEGLLRLAVRGMLPKNRLGRAQLKKLKIYSGSEHPHLAQMPVPLTL